VVGHDQPENGIAEELEALVGLVSRVLGAPAPVPQRQLEEGCVGEGMADPQRPTTPSAG